ncbi:TraB/GumN family protein [Glaciimonas immobilis]|uniref:TraB/GumN family protein n=1 Tax=Glaciimonas immobilis TaxID=728004 RepID=A0A840S1C3_9BURK|nr:TraB/GumN family protein [Glaciimonas immobilis]KAF3997285.1 TraB/GumN family protein [Glaciimonas immobilis]MBB5202420.1 hypothetical protein [Glaciimonas immobilis]
MIPFFLAGMYAVTALAKDASTKSLNPATTSTRQGGALFKVQRDGHTTYLFGTIHVGSADFFPLAPAVMDALNQSSRIAIEIDTSDTQALNLLLQHYALYPNDSASAQDMPAALTRQVHALLDKYRMTPTDVVRMKPWLLATMLTTEEYARNGFPKEQGVDNYLSNYAQTQHKPLIGLESVKYQLSLLGDLSIAEQNQFLQDTVNDLEDPVRARKALDLVTLWRSGDLSGLEKLMKEMTSDETFTGKFIQRTLLDGRNPALADAVEKLLKSEKTTFAGIGMLHLVGDKSVQALLRQRGYRVQRTY